MYRFAIVCVVCLGPVLQACAQQTKEADWAKIDRLRQQFNESQRKVNEAFLKKFDAVALAVGKNSRLAPEVRLKHQAVIKSQKAAFEKDGTLPSFDDLMPATWDHLEALHRARYPVARAYDDALKHYARTGQVDAGRSLAQDKARFDEQLPGRNAFERRTNWSGYRVGAKKNIPFSFKAGALDGSVLKGRVTQTDDAGQVVFELQVEGRLDGNHVELQTTQTIKGNYRNLAFSGYVVDKRLFLQIGGAGAKGRPVGGLVVLRLGKE